MGLKNIENYINGFMVIEMSRSNLIGFTNFLSSILFTIHSKIFFNRYLSAPITLEGLVSFS